MNRAIYYVVFHEHQWKVKYGNDHFGPFATQKDAMDAAVEAAHKNSESGILSQVVVQGEDNQWQTEWTYGKDPYPPEG